MQHWKQQAHSSIDLTKYLSNYQVIYMKIGRFFQDSLDNYFGRQRLVGCHKDNLN